MHEEERSTDTAPEAPPAKGILASLRRTLSGRKVAADQESPEAAGLLVALNVTRGAHIYGGTVSAKVKGQRRAANKRARVSRRQNRGQR